MTDREDVIDEIATPIVLGMRSVPSSQVALDEDTARKMRQRLDEFDAVRTRGDIESRTVHLGIPGQS